MTADNEARSIEIWDDPESGAYLVEVDGSRVGKAEYRMRGGRHWFVHTEVDDEYEGTGIGTKLVQFALDDVRAKGGLVVPICPFFAAYLRRHPEYEEIVDREMTDRVERSRREREV